MKTVCAWCDTVMENGALTEGDNVSHGICKDCKKMVKKEMEEIPEKPALIPLDTYDLIEH